MPDSMSRNKKLKHVQRVIELLDLTSCEDTSKFLVPDFEKLSNKRNSFFNFLSIF